MLNDYSIVQRFAEKMHTPTNCQTIKTQSHGSNDHIDHALHQKDSQN